MRNMNRSDGRPINKHTRSIRRIRSKEKIDIVFHFLLDVTPLPVGDRETTTLPFEQGEGVLVCPTQGM